MRRPVGQMVLVAAVIFGSLVGCVDDSDQGSPSTDPVEAPTTTTSSVDASSAVVSEATVTATAYPAQPSAATDTPSGWNRAGGFAVGLIGDTGEVVAIDLTTGAVEESLAQVDIEASWLGRFQLDWGGTAVFYSVQTEDYWFSCETSPGRVIRLDLASGEETLVALGAEPQVSPDGIYLAYLASSQCLPDPTDPGNFVVTPYDTVVVRDLASGAERSWVDIDLQAELAATEGDVLEAELRGLAWLGPDELAIGEVRLVASTMDLGEVGANIGPEAGAFQTVIGFHQTTGELLVEQEVFVDDRREAHLIGLDPTTGQGTAHATPSSADALFAFDSANRNLIVLDSGRLVVDGREIVVEAALTNLDW